jgi:imidazolonepropionase-like amidohydrolase
MGDEERRSGAGRATEASTTFRGRLELRNGRVVDVVAGRAHGPETRIVIEGAEIVALPGLPGQPAPPPDLVMDLRGLTVIPGLFNTHTHVALPMPGTLLGPREALLPKRFGPRQVRENLVACLERGITNVRDCLCEDLRISRRLKRAVEGLAPGGPRLHQAVLVGQEGGTFTARRGAAARYFLPLLGLPALDYDDPDSGILSFPRGAAPSAVRAAVDRAIDERGADCIKIYDQREQKLTYRPGATLMSEAQLGALADQARRRGVPSTIHHVTVESFRRAVRAGVTSLAHLPIDGPLTEADVRAFGAAGCTIEPTATLAYFFSFELVGEPDHPRLARLGQLRTPDHRRRIEELWVPELRPLVRAALDRAVRGRRRAFGVFDVAPVFRYFSRVVSHGFDNVGRIAREAGLAAIACGNDAGPSQSTPAGVALEIEMLDLCLATGEAGAPGLEAADALRVATINSARALGLGSRYGSIEPGKVADLVVVEGDPLSDWRVLGRPVAAVFKGGALVVNRCGLEVADRRGTAP